MRRLAAELRRLSATTDLSREDVAEQTGINNVTLYRIETARAKPQMRTLMSLLNLYGTQGEQRTQLVELSKDATKQGWLRPFHTDLPEEYTAYISFEAEAHSLRNYQSLFVPGLLQTEAYARPVVQGVLPQAGAQDVEDRVQARMERQRLLVGDLPLRLWAIIDEAALHRLVGGPSVMRDQLNRLIEVSAQPNVTLQVIDYAAGAHAGMPGSFALMDFDDPMDTDLIYIDSMAGDLFLESDADVRRYTTIFDHLRAVARSPAGSTSLLAELAHRVE
ncbi:helix-turn-helix transcriptional regulator [Actinokineospora sp. NBRC 105648]|uniref:helix-turn-helix domain-containing protein n=1 Tax=Actinokineospora sp. NBRC 105648 TaxID=3032206 RepID=UPI00255221DF|nr:helix-turn-helix transcriptional regulator [Actinokineospora sp. NBRC 105648]